MRNCPQIVLDGIQAKHVLSAHTNNMRTNHALKTKARYVLITGSGEKMESVIQARFCGPENLNNKRGTGIDH